MKEAAEKAEGAGFVKEAAQKAEAERLVKEAAEKAEADRLVKEAAEKAEADRLAKEVAEKAEADRLAEVAEKAEADRLAKEAAEKAEADRLAEVAEKAEADRLAKQVAEKAEADRFAKEAAEKAEAARLAHVEKLERQKAREEAARTEALRSEKLAAEKLKELSRRASSGEGNELEGRVRSIAKSAEAYWDAQDRAESQRRAKFRAECKEAIKEDDPQVQAVLYETFALLGKLDGCVFKMDLLGWDIRPMLQKSLQEAVERCPMPLPEGFVEVKDEEVSDDDRKNTYKARLSCFDSCLWQDHNPLLPSVPSLPDFTPDPILTSIQILEARFVAQGCSLVAGAKSEAPGAPR